MADDGAGDGKFSTGRNLDVVVSYLRILEEDAADSYADDVTGDRRREGRSTASSSEPVWTFDSSRMRPLRLSDVYAPDPPEGEDSDGPSDPPHRPSRATLVDCPSSVRSFTDELSRALDLSADADDGVPSSWADRPAVGIDCEWRPSCVLSS